MTTYKYIFGSPTVKFLPRQQIREFDRNDKVFRSHHDSVEYSDNLSLAFVTSTLINYPTTLPVDTTSLMHVSGYRVDTNYLTYLTSSLSTLGDIRQQCVGTWLREVYTGSIAPFKEVGLHELENFTDYFYMTGSRLEDVGEGLTNPLKDKHQIKFELYVSGDTPLNPESGSAYYYDFNLKTFSEVAPELRMSPSSSYLTPNDYRLFSPAGHPLMSGTHFLSISDDRNYEFTIPAWCFSAGTTTNTIQRFISLKESGSFCLNPLFDASSSQIFNLKKKLKYPFVVESALINVPIKAGSSWLNDKTTFHITYSLDCPETTEGSLSSWGGPCVNFAILNQFSDSRKDIILSASLVPSGDLQPEWYESYLGGGSARCPKGFQVFNGEAAGYIDSTTTYTGSVTLKAKSAVSNGFYAQYFGVSPNLINAYPMQINNVGRCLDGKASSRSIYGKEHIYNSSKNRINPNDSYFGELTTDIDAVTYAFMESRNSPYVIFPEDNISFLITKHRSSHLTDMEILSASHDVQIGEGEMTVTLYGSYLQNDKEYPFTVDSNDTSRSQESFNTTTVLKTIGNDPVLDQFENYAYTDQLSGTYLDQYITGSMLTERGLVLHQFNPGEKTVIEGPLYSIRAYRPSEFLNHFVYVQSFDSREIFNDSLIPSISDIWKKDGKYPYTDGLTLPVFVLDEDEAEPANVSNTIWSKSFPFEPRYSGLSRYTYDSIKFNIYSTDGSKILKTTDNVWVALYARTAADAELLLTIYDIRVVDDEELPLSKEELAKLMFGIGDLQTYRSGANGYFGTTSFPDARMRKTNTLISVIPRGWKYGLLSGLTTYTSIILNPKSHGQFRDILEQRLDSKMYYNSIAQSDNEKQKSTKYVGKSPIEVRFVDSDGKTTLPEKTDSSNLSLHATSSLPFFDGLHLNRDVPNTNYINTSMISMKNDGVGNFKIF